MDAVVVDAVRTPMGCGRPEGALAGIPAWWLLAELFGTLVRRNNLVPGQVDRILLAAPLEPAGARQVGRRAWHEAGLCRRAWQEPGTSGAEPTIDSFDIPGCRAGSGQDLVHRAVRSVTAGEAELVLVAGVESSFAVRATDSPDWALPGIAAELLAAQWGLNRRQLDEYAARSRRHAAEVAAMGEFRPEIVPVHHPVGDRAIAVAEDETIHACPDGASRSLYRDERLAAKYPEIGWHITNRNACAAADGAVAMLIGTDRLAADYGIRHRARFVALAESADEGTAVDGPARTTKAVLAESGMEINEMDHYEVSETFAPIALAWQQQFQTDMDRFNPRGGAIALGRSSGAAGLRSMTTMLRALEDTGGTFGLQVMDDAAGRTRALVVQRRQ